MSPQFNNMNELTSYLDTMENRVKTLESQNVSLKLDIADLSVDSPNMLPKTGLLSHSFFKRAFTVWGHYFIAQLIISLVIVLILATLLLIPGLFSAFMNFIRGLSIP